MYTQVRPAVQVERPRAEPAEAPAKAYQINSTSAATGSRVSAFATKQLQLQYSIDKASLGGGSGRRVCTCVFSRAWGFA